MSGPTKKNLADGILPHLSSALRDLHLGKVFVVVFVVSH